MGHREVTRDRARAPAERYHVEMTGSSRQLQHTGAPRVALATHAGLPSLGDDDRLLMAALAARKVDASPAVWNDERVDWAGFSCVVVRSCWDYHLRPAAFHEWIHHLERGYNQPFETLVNASWGAALVLVVLILVMRLITNCISMKKFGRGGINA